MVALDPDNMKWRMEVQYADANLGVVLIDQRRFAEASKQLEQALRGMDAFATADPHNMDYQKSLVGIACLDRLIHIWRRDASTLRSRTASATSRSSRAFSSIVAIPISARS